ncbi:MAG: oligosaccharide flippase family protein [Caulobacteraceae bacterium]
MALILAEDPARTATAVSRQPRTPLGVNVLANSASQIFVVLAGVSMLPFYLRRMGAEAYGLIGFFTLMNAWFQILDGGLSLTLTRESARFRAGAIDAPTLHALVRTMEVFFFAVAGAGALTIMGSAHAIATSWLRVDRLPIDAVAKAVLLMGLTVPLQWMTGLYRGAINGFERQAWLSGFNAAIAALRFGGAAIVITVLGPSLWNFFCYQLAVSTLELGVLITVGRAILPPIDPSQRRFLKWREARGLLAFSGSLALAVLVWSLVTQVDKLVLSRILPLADYGVFTLAVAAAGGVLVVSAPISQALLPRLAKLAAEGAATEVIGLYRRATQLVCLITVPAALVLAIFAGPVIWAWTGDARTTAAAAPILTAYALGNGVMTLGAFPYYLQYAKGDLRLHVIGNILLVVVLVPALVLAASRFGAVGAGYVWLGLNALYLVAWVPLVHHRIAAGLHWRWLARDVLPITIATGLAGGALSMLIAWPHDRRSTAALLALVGGLLVLVGACVSPAVREWARAAVRRAAARSRPYAT